MVENYCESIVGSIGGSTGGSTGGSMYELLGGICVGDFEGRNFERWSEGHIRGGLLI